MNPFDGGCGLNEVREMPIKLRSIPRRRGFTLVELLVVIGIIAVLIGILLPTLSKVREQGNKTVCLSGLRQMGQILHLYADDNQGLVPIGYASSKHAGYMVWQSGAFQVIGCFYNAGYFTGPKAFYCPSQLDDRWHFNSANNPWPPPPAASTSLVRLGFTARPAVMFNGEKPVSSTSDAVEHRGNFPVLSNFRNKAVFAEMFGEPMNNAAVNVDPRITNHKDAINVLFNDGSAEPVGTQKVDPADGQSIYTLLDQLYNLKAVPTGAQANQIYLDEAVTPNTGIWAKFDQTRE